MGCYFRDSYTFYVKAENVEDLKKEFAEIHRKLGLDECELVVSDTPSDKNGRALYRVYLQLGGQSSYGTASMAEDLGAGLANKFRVGVAEVSQECDGETGTHYMADSDEEAAAAEADKYLNELRLLHKRLSKAYLQKLSDEINAWGL